MVSMGTETVRMETVPLSLDNESGGIRVYTSDFKYKFQLKPIYELLTFPKFSLQDYKRRCDHNY
jgi:hypothetical protein